MGKVQEASFKYKHLFKKCTPSKFKSNYVPISKEEQLCFRSSSIEGTAKKQGEHWYITPLAAILFMKWDVTI